MAFNESVSIEGTLTVGDSTTTNNELSTFYGSLLIERIYYNF